MLPVGRGLGRLGTVLVVVPALWCHRCLLTPAGHAVAWLARGVGAGPARVHACVLRPIGQAVAWLLTGIGAVLAAMGIGVYPAVARLARCLLVLPAHWLYDRVLAPVGRAVARCGRGLGWLPGVLGTGVAMALYWALRVLIVLPALAPWRRVLAPVGRFLAVVTREVGDALGHAWRIAGRISRAVGRVLGTLFRWIFVEPLRRVYRNVLTPVGHLVRDAVLRPAAEGARGGPGRPRGPHERPRHRTAGPRRLPADPVRRAPAAGLGGPAGTSGARDTYSW